MFFACAELSMCHIIGSVLFIDGVFRVVYLDHGQEYFVNDAGQPVYGEWSNLDGEDVTADEVPPPFAVMPPMYIADDPDLLGVDAQWDASNEGGVQRL